jgi:hypothetical protein
MGPGIIMAASLPLHNGHRMPPGLQQGITMSGSAVEEAPTAATLQEQTADSATGPQSAEFDGSASASGMALLPCLLPILPESAAL